MSVVGRPRADAVAIWVSHNGHRTPLCVSCLNSWCDNADDDPSLEPAEIIWLIDRRSIMLAGAA
jgi:hypothetical protein